MHIIVLSLIAGLGLSFVWIAIALAGSKPEEIPSPEGLAERDREIRRIAAEEISKMSYEDLVGALIQVAEGAELRYQGDPQRPGKPAQPSTHECAEDDGGPDDPPTAAAVACGIDPWHLKVGPVTRPGPPHH